MRPRLLALVALVAAVAACGEPNATSPTTRPQGPRSVLDDGSRAGGNQDFFFLPPLVPNPVNLEAFEAGRFNPLWQPTVEVCNLVDTDPQSSDPDDLVCGTNVQTFAFGAGGVTLNPAEQLYQLNLDTRAGWATAGLYRATVYVAPAPGETDELGFIDFELLPNQQAVKKYGTTDVVPLMDGRTVPLKFRIEYGATVNDDYVDYAEQPVTNAGGIVRTVDAETGEPGDAVLSFAPGWLGDEATEVIVTVARLDGTADAAACLTAAPDVINTSSCWRVTTLPDIQQVHADVTVAFCPAIGESDPRYDFQSIYKHDEATETQPRRLRALPSAPEPEPLLCEPPPVIGSRDDGPLGALRRGATWLASGIGRLVGPTTAYALDAGLGGQLRAGDEAFSEFFWGVPLRVDVVGPASVAGTIGEALSVSVRVTTANEHEEDDPVAITGRTVYASGVTGGTVASPTAVTNADGIATFLFTPTAASSNVTFGVDQTGINVPATLTVTSLSSLIACTTASAYGGDFIDRGFYIGSYPGTTLQGADLSFSAATAGTYEIRLTARAGAYGGTVLAQDTETVVIPSGDVNSFVGAGFRWPSVSVTPGSTVAFDMTLVSGPSLPYYREPSLGDPNCPVTQTNGTTPPLDTFRRQGIYGIIYGTAPVIP